MNDFWYRLICALVVTGRVDNGPTIPFVIGAYRHRFKKADFGIADLLLILKGGPRNSRIMYCGPTQSYVLTINRYAIDYPAEPSRENGYLSFCAELIDERNAIDTLSTEYDPFLEKFQYSSHRTEPQWREFSEDEISFIEGIKVL